MSSNEPTSPSQSGTRARLHECYERLWAGSLGKLQSGHVELDPVLATKVPDRRRGLTVIARPSPAVRQGVASFLEQLRQLEPEQHYYAPSEFHVTVLSLFTATIEHERFFAQQERYVAAVDAAVEAAAPLRIEFSGITASPGAIMVQGFCDTEALNELRDGLRRQLQLRHLTEGVDVRYRLEVAHMTVARFRAPLRDGPQLAAALERARQQPFGTAAINRLSLVKNDWYMTRRLLETVKRYPLRQESARR